MNTLASFFQTLTQLSSIEIFMVIFPLLVSFIVCITLTLVSKKKHLRLGFSLLSLMIFLAAPFSVNFQVNHLVLAQQTQQDAIKYQQSLLTNFNLVTADTTLGDELLNSRFMKKFNQLEGKQKEVVDLLTEVIADANKQIVAKMTQQTDIIDDLLSESEGYLSDKVSSSSVDIIARTASQQVISAQVINEINQGVSAIVDQQKIAMISALQGFTKQFKTELNQQMKYQLGRFHQDITRTTEQQLALYSQKQQEMLSEVSAVLANANQKFSHDLHQVSAEINKIEQVLQGENISAASYQTQDRLGFIDKRTGQMKHKLQQLTNMSDCLRQTPMIYSLTKANLATKAPCGEKLIAITHESGNNIGNVSRKNRPLIYN